MRETRKTWVLGIAGLASVGCRQPPVVQSPQAAEEDSPSVSEPRDADEEPASQPTAFTLATLRASFETVVKMDSDREPAPDPPPETFSKVSFAGPLGQYVAYVTPERSGKRRPAIVWIPGGFDWGIGSWLWEAAPRTNDQTAAAFRDAGLVLMLPALRGANENPGHAECFGGEVDDIVAAADYLASRSDVDPERIYLGGHSTGGTMALLVAETTARFRAVFSFGPLTHPLLYGEAGCLDAKLPAEELEARSPGRFLSEIVTPTFIVEGSGGNSDALPLFEDLKGEAPITVIEVPRSDHFSVLAPASEYIAREILRDDGDEVDLIIDRASLVAATAH